MASWSNKDNSDNKRPFPWSVVIMVIAFGLALLIGARNAQSSEPVGANTLEWRVSHLEGDMRGAYSNTSYLTQRVIALDTEVAKLRHDFGEAFDMVISDQRVDEHAIKVLRNQARVTRAGLRACLRNRSYIGHTQEDTHWLLAQCLDDYGVPH